MAYLVRITRRYHDPARRRYATTYVGRHGDDWKAPIVPFDSIDAARKWIVSEAIFGRLDSSEYARPDYTPVPIHHAPENVRRAIGDNPK